jgi:hypothetical protein
VSPARTRRPWLLKNRGRSLTQLVRYQHYIRRKRSGYDTLERTMRGGFPPRSNSLIARWRIHALCSSTHTRRIRNWFEPLQICTRLYAMLALPHLHLIFFYIVYLLSNVSTFSINFPATSSLTTHSRNLMCTTSNLPRHSLGKGRKQSCVQKCMLLGRKACGGNCASEMSIASTVMFGKVVASSLAQILRTLAGTGRDWAGMG